MARSMRSRSARTRSRRRTRPATVAAAAASSATCRFCASTSRCSASISPSFARSTSSCARKPRSTESILRALHVEPRPQEVRGGRLLDDALLRPRLLDLGLRLPQLGAPVGLLAAQRGGVELDDDVARLHRRRRSSPAGRSGGRPTAWARRAPPTGPAGCRSAAPSRPRTRCGRPSAVGTLAPRAADAAQVRAAAAIARQTPAAAHGCAAHQAPRGSGGRVRAHGVGGSRRHRHSPPAADRATTAPSARPDATTTCSSLTSPTVIDWRVNEPPRRSAHPRAARVDGHGLARQQEHLLALLDGDVHGRRQVGHQAGIGAGHGDDGHETAHGGRHGAGDRQRRHLLDDAVEGQARVGVERQRGRAGRRPRGRRPPG